MLAHTRKRGNLPTKQGSRSELSGSARYGKIEVTIDKDGVCNPPKRTLSTSIGAGANRALENWRGASYLPREFAFKGADRLMYHIPKDQLVTGAYYIGKCRNARIARWDGKRFIHWRTKFGDTFLEKIDCPEDNDQYDVFLADQRIEFKEIPLDPPPSTIS